jgi:hypothetical protein
MCGSVPMQCIVRFIVTHQLGNGSKIPPNGFLHTSEPIVILPIALHILELE